MLSELETRQINYNFSSIEKQALNKVATSVRIFYQSSKPEMGAHYFDHIQRVAGMAGRISVLENQDPFQKVLTALFFDTGRVSNDPRAHTPHHGIISYEIFGNLIETLKIFSGTELEIIKAAVEDHPLLNHQVRESDLVKILMDADRLGTIGALAPTRAASTRWKMELYNNELANSTSPHELDLKTIYQDIAFRLPKWYQSIWTPSAKIMAEPRQEFLLKYIEQLTYELKAMHNGYQSLGIEE